MEKLIGSHYVLVALPVWASAGLLFLITAVPILVLRDYFEGIPYNVAYSAVIGDAALIVAVLVAATILQRGELLPAWLVGSNYHKIALGIGIFLGIMWLATDPPKYWGDKYHHAVVAPLLAYLAATLLPVIFVNGTKAEKIAVLCFFLVWSNLVGLDILQKRMDQRRWLAERGVTLKN